jgi:hypothetical protein
MNKSINMVGLVSALRSIIGQSGCMFFTTRISNGFGHSDTELKIKHLGLNKSLSQRIFSDKKFVRGSWHFFGPTSQSTGGSYVVIDMVTACRERDTHTLS